MTELPQLLLTVFILAVAIWLTSNAVFAAYFRAREAYWYRVMHRMKETSNAEKCKNL